MNLVSIRIITRSVNRLVTFYEVVTASPARWATTDFAEIVTSAGTLAIGSERTAALFAAGSVEPATNRSVIIEFRVDDVDAEYRRLAGQVGEVVQEPTTMPWGNRSALVRDPDGNLVNLFTPVTSDALARQDG
ncbi:VOC family protein [Gordonia sp. DT218]|uniref:VOC family protein n=1 Tax=Gordonia sp. DT218 TaxID=3416659 RepID=UPI003CFB874B